MMESNLRRGLLQTGDNVIEFISGPITLLFIGLTILSLGWPFISKAIANSKNSKQATNPTE